MWKYAHSSLIAEDYDDFFAVNSLFDFDEEVVASVCAGQRAGAVVVDWGCGTGRALLPLVRRGMRGLAIDISQHMLSVVRQKAALEDLRIDCVRANLVELDAVRDGVADVGMCLFSTLGMIRGRANRRRALVQMRRILRPGGVLVLHVHNLWYHLFEASGIAWLAKNLLTAPLDRDLEVGDRIFAYRGIDDMFLHSFRIGELVRDLKAAGWAKWEIIPLDARRRHALGWPWLAGRLRANGWIAVCRR